MPPVSGPRCAGGEEIYSADPDGSNAADRIRNDAADTTPAQNRHPHVREIQLAFR
jgi:hypothetical protein